MKYYISDTHFGSLKTIKKSNRPFKNTKEMDMVLIDNWNNIVDEDDFIYILGDFAYKEADEEYIETILQKLKGHLILIYGNHDTPILNSKRLRKYFLEITQIKTVIDNNCYVTMCHYPLTEWEFFWEGNSYHFFGHIHNDQTETASIMTSISRTFNVGADCLGFMPRTLDEIINSKE